MHFVLLIILRDLLSMICIIKEITTDGFAIYATGPQISRLTVSQIASKFFWVAVSRASLSWWSGGTLKNTIVSRVFEVWDELLCSYSCPDLVHVLTCWQRLLQLILYPLPLSVCAFGCYIHTTEEARYTVSLVQWVNRLLPPREAAVRVTVMHPYLQWNRVLLSAMSGYIGDPDLSDQDDLLGHRTNNGKFHWAVEHNVKSRHHPTTLLPYYNSARCRSLLFAI